LIEDESRLIGQNQVPEGFFNRLRSSSVIWLDEPFEVRLENIYREYILETAIGSYSKKTESDSQEKSDKAALDVFSRYKKSVHSIQKKLGGLRTQEILSDIAESEIRFQETQETSLNKIWIEKLLKYYYDPMYLGSLERRAVKIEFKGNAHEVAAFLSQKISK
jgi:tRNA 2-selenouridine synthase